MDALTLADCLYSLSSLGGCNPGPEFLAAAAERLQQLAGPLEGTTAPHLPDPEALVNALVALARWEGSALLLYSMAEAVVSCHAGITCIQSGHWCLRRGWIEPLQIIVGAAYPAKSQAGIFREPGALSGVDFQ